LTYGTSLSIDFASDEDQPYYATCALSFSLWNTAGDAVLKEVVCSCSVSSLYAYCYFPSRIPAGTYMAEFTISDWIGNWQVLTSADEATLLDVEIANNRVDTMPPMLVAMEPTAAATVTIPAANADSTTAGAYVNFWVDAHDNEGTDDWASGVMSGGITITDSDDEPMMFALTGEGSEYDDDDNLVYSYGAAVQFYNWADADSWTVDNFWAVDNAGNVAMSTSAAFDITLATLVTAEDGNRPPQCDTFGIGDDSYMVYTSSDYNVIDTTLNPIDYYATSYVYFNMECNADYTGWNYAGALFASPQVLLAGETMAASLWAQTEEGYLPPPQLTFGDYDFPEDIASAYPGASLYGSGDLSYWYDQWTVYEGFPIGEYTLDRVYTSTETGAVQVYDAALGAASSVVPSVVVIVALATAMLL